MNKQIIKKVLKEVIGKQADAEINKKVESLEKNRVLEGWDYEKLRIEWAVNYTIGLMKIKEEELGARTQEMLLHQILEEHVEKDEKHYQPCQDCIRLGMNKSANLRDTEWKDAIEKELRRTYHCYHGDDCVSRKRALKQLLEKMEAKK